MSHDEEWKLRLTILSPTGEPVLAGERMKPLVEVARAVTANTVSRIDHEIQNQINAGIADAQTGVDRSGGVIRVYLDRKRSS